MHMSCIINQSILYYALFGIIYESRTEWQSKRMTYNILGVSMLCQLTSLVIGSDERGDIPNKHNWGIN